MPRDTVPMAGSPAPETSLPSMVMCADLVTLMPWPAVSAIVNPRTMIQLFELIRNPLHGAADDGAAHRRGP